MTLAQARAVADAVLFDGNLLQPHRAPALQNRMRWQFGVLAPRRAGGAETWFQQTECLVEAAAETTVDIRVRCVQLRHDGGESQWDEGIVREFAVPVTLGAIEQPRTVMFELPAGTERRDGQNWHRYRVPGLIHIECHRACADRPVRRLQVRVENHSEWAPGPADVRENVLRRSLASVHTMFAVRGGEFVSLLEPPEWADELAAACRNISTWPVLVGSPADRDAMLSSPVILADHPSMPVPDGDGEPATAGIPTPRRLAEQDALDPNIGCWDITRWRTPRLPEQTDRSAEQLYSTFRYPWNDS